MKTVLFILLATFQISSAKRVVDIYAKDKTDKLYQKQIKLFATEAKGMQERDILIKEHFGNQSFKIILTGKDGLKKYSSTAPVTTEKLFSIIDSMPMRKNEILKN